MQIPVMHIIAIENPERKYVGIIVQSHVTIYVVMDGWIIRAKIRFNPHLHLLFFFFLYQTYFTSFNIFLPLLTLHFCSIKLLVLGQGQRCQITYEKGYSF